MQELKVYGLLASSIAGKTVSVWASAYASTACTDGSKIFLPAQGPQTDLQKSVIAQALLLRSGDLSPSIMLRIAGRSRLTRRYFIAETCRAVSENRSRLPQLFLESMELQKLPCPCNSSQESLSLARNSIQLPLLPGFMGQLKPWLLIRNAVRVTPQDGSPAAKGEPSLTGQKASHSPDSADDRDPSLLSQFYNPLRKGRHLSEFLGLQSKSSQAQSFNATGGQMLVSRGRRRLARDKPLNITGWYSERDEAGRQLGSQTIRHPEWNFRAGRYRTDWVTIQEKNAPVEKVPVRLNEYQFTPPPHTLKRAVAGIGMSFENHPRQSHGDKLSLDSVIQYTIDSIAGCTPDDRVYLRQLKTHRDLAVLTLLDISASVADLDAEGNSIHSVQSRIAYQLTRALHEFGDSVALYAYNSFGRHDVRFLRIKSFSDNRIDSLVHRRLEALTAEGYTRSGAALRHAALKLKREAGLPHCLMVLITDGFAYDLDYDQRYAEEDTRRALEEVRRQGVGCLCLSVAPIHQEQKLREVYGAASTLSVRDYGQFVANLRPALKSAIQQIRYS